MKLLKIGSSSSCDIVLHSEFVSAYHAELILLDNGEIILEDKNSTNGTFVGSKKVSPNSETSVRRGDYIRFADTELQWAHVPALENNSKYKAIISIGSNFRNDIVITGNYSSRFHATIKVAKDGKAYIIDSGSKNGTKVNGVKIQSGKEVRIKRGDIVICGDADVTEQIKQYLPQPFPWLKVVATVGIAALLVGVVFMIMPGTPCDVCGMKGCKGHAPQEFRSAVVYVKASYHYVVTFEDNPVPELWNGKTDIYLTDRENNLLGQYFGTAFFIDREGRMATNRHVVLPWDERYSNPTESEFIKTEIEKLRESLPTIRYEEDLAALLEFNLNGVALGQMLYESAKPSVSILNAKINRLKKSPLKISGKLDRITVGYPGRNYTHEDEYERCFVLAESGFHELDIAILQMNNKKTPDDVKLIFDVNNIEEEKLEPLKDQLFTIGYPRGEYWAKDKNTHSLEPVIRETMCSKMPSKYTFEFQGESVGGASGSPIFNKKGHLVGILWGGWYHGTTFGLACQAKYLKELYEKEVGL